MKRYILFLLSGVLLSGTIACQNVTKTSSDAPSSTQESPKSPTKQVVQKSQKNAESLTRRTQLNSDIRAREQRNNISGGTTNRVDSDLASEVRDKLQANIPRSQLVVDAKKGIVTVSGTVNDQQNLKKIEPLTMQIKGVKSVVNKSTFIATKSN